MSAHELPELEGVKYNIKVNTVAQIAASRLTEDSCPDLLAKMNHEYVAPSSYISVRRNAATPAGFSIAEPGFYNRVAMMTSPALCVGGGKKIPSLEDVPPTGRKSWISRVPRNTDN